MNFEWFVEYWIYIEHWIWIKCTIIPKTNWLMPRSVETLNPSLNIEWFVEHWMACWLTNMPWTLNCSLNIKHLNIEWFIEYSHEYTLNMGNRRKCTIVSSIVETLKHPLNIEWFIEHWMILWILNMHWTLNGSLNIKVYDTKFFIHAGHARPRKYRVVNNFLSFYSVILKLGTKKELVIL